MWLQVDKETKRIRGYIDFCEDKPIAETNCELVEVDAIPVDWEYSVFTDGEITLDNLYKTTKEEETIINDIRNQRSIECFPIINRGFLWFNALTDEQKEELNNWYQTWLDAPATKEVPTKPKWLK